MEQTLMQHLEQREFTRALNLYRSLERDGRDLCFSEELYSAFVQSAIRVGKIDVVERMLGGMRRSGTEPSRAFWQTTLKMLSSRKHFSACLSIYANFSTWIPNDKVVLSCLINAALDLGQPERAAAMLKAYSAADLDAKDHVLFFRTYQVLGDADAAEAVFRKLGKETSTLMLNLLLLTCTNARQPERGMALLNEAHELETGCQERMTDVVSYNTVIKGFVQANQSARCFDCLSQMRDKGLEPDAITFGALLELCIADGQTALADELLSSLISSSRPLDTVMCTLFIKGLVKANCVERALQLCEEMKRRKGATPDIITYSVLIKALVDQHELERAFGLLEEMVGAGHRPDDIIYTHLLEGCRHAGNHTLGSALFRRMLESGVKPSEYTLVTVLKLHGRCGHHQEAYDLVASWEKEHGMRPSVIHFTCLMSGCLRTRNYQQAWKAYELMCSCGIKPDSTALSTLLPGLVAGQQWDRVVELAEVAVQMGPNVVPMETLNNALAQLQGAAGQSRLAERLRDLMSAAGVPVTRRPTGGRQSLRR
eukprot:SRR837773.8113.p1 GENE.SRR837773.8113~~SRR837773.8113.p1  ORF type:complete len:623 (+),score=238.33 SRR837773.8113:251-1870(+)